MLFQTHLLFSILIALISIFNLNLSNKYTFLIILIFSTSIPDLDIPTSKLGRRFKFISTLINIIFSHRGFLHSILFPLILYFLFSFLFGLKEIGLAVFLGIISHLFLDSLTKDGISPFNPFYNKRIKGFITTGSLSEKIFFLIILILILYFSISFL